MGSLGWMYLLNHHLQFVDMKAGGSRILLLLALMKSLDIIIDKKSIQYIIINQYYNLSSIIV